MNLRALAYSFWTIFVVRFSLAFLSFRDQPKAATFLQAVISLAFAVVLLALRLSSAIAAVLFLFGVERYKPLAAVALSFAIALRFALCFSCGPRFALLGFVNRPKLSLVAPAQ